ncbi:MAG TPA: asparagine synthetase B, partial [Ruminiclostridium sp.]|nr:asparagine synthetase B [Ruminiclostridium sp.]
MCGIVGAFGTRGNFTMEALHKATEALYHRGPDGRQHWMSEDGRVGLGHSRLSIIDLEGGTQPLQNEDGSIHAVVNGELYDFERIRRGLEEKGHRFSTASDSEILIHLYEESGVDALHELRGEFAFILYDSNTRRLFAARDRFGVKPLYYTYFNNVLYLASEIKALLAAGADAVWDEESLYISFHLGVVPMQDRTFFKGVYQVPPAHYMIASNDQY